MPVKTLYNSKNLCLTFMLQSEQKTSCITSISKFISLTNFRPMFPFHNPWKHQTTVGVKRKHWPEMG